MQIVSRGQNVAVSDGLVAHCVGRARRALRPFRSRIAHVQLVFRDLALKGQGLGRSCRVTVELVGGGQVRYEGRADDHYQSASEALVGTARYIQRKLERRRGHSFARRRVTLPVH
ncbi:MAG TPA: HPF/RaiA family ribosome-associated protein [Polyangiales bacterium]|nr:HPF/RaiA family ribosome-associated protein [Polyangiales bacterium]